MSSTSTMTKAQLAYRRIRRMIVRRQFAADRQWSLRKLSRKLGISVVPISEAVRRLEQEGLLDTRPQSGIRLRQLSPAESKELTVVREALEVQAARLFTLRATERQLAKLDRLATQLVTALAAGDSDRATQWDFEFHRQLMVASGCRLLAAKHDEVATLCIVTRGRWDNHWQESEMSGIASHKAVVTALASGDPDVAANVIRAHIGADVAPGRSRNRPGK